jgi:hypothetical protein
VQFILILVPKAKICRKIRWFHADFSCKGLKPKDLNIQGLICIRKDTKTKTKKIRAFKDENNI